MKYTHTHTVGESHEEVSSASEAAAASSVEHVTTANCTFTGTRAAPYACIHSIAKYMLYEKRKKTFEMTENGEKKNERKKTENI